MPCSRLFPALLEILFPVLCPRPAEVIDPAGLTGKQLRRPAVGTIHDRTLHTALTEGEPGLRIVRSRPPVPRRDRMQRPNESFRIVERGLDDQALSIRVRTDDFHGLHLVAVFEHGMRQRPALHIGRPGHERVAVPETGRFAVPLWNAGLNMLSADVNLPYVVL